MRKVITIRKELAKAHIAADKAQRAVYALVPRSDVRLCDILIQPQFATSAQAVAWQVACLLVDTLRDELRQQGEYAN